MLLAGFESHFWFNQQFDVCGGTIIGMSNISRAPQFGTLVCGVIHAITVCQ